MRLPRDIGGLELARLLAKYGYHVTRQTGSHIRLTSEIRFREHSITIPRHKSLRIGTLTNILSEVASYLEIDKRNLIRELFK